MGFFPKINIYDVFCGEGIYPDKKEGSPIIARKLIESALLKFPQQKIALTINDKNIANSNNKSIENNLK